MRDHNRQTILQALQQVQAHAGKPSAGISIRKILQTIKAVETEAPTDPVLEILFAFYDALAYNDLWATYTANQYRKAHQVLTRLGNRPINTRQIEKAIAALDAAGFDTMPYVFSFVDEDET